MHFVDQKQNRSLLLNMTIEEYRQRLAQHQTLGSYSTLVSEMSGSELRASEVKGSEVPDPEVQ